MWVDLRLGLHHQSCRWLGNLTLFMSVLSLSPLSARKGRGGKREGVKRGALSALGADRKVAVRIAGG